MTIAAALLAGAAVGFLFGLPKTLAQAETRGLLTTTSTGLDEEGRPPGSNSSMLIEQNDESLVPQRYLSEESPALVLELHAA